MRFKYRDKGTIIHRLNPLCKMAWVVSVFVLALTLDDPFFLVLLFLSTLPVVAAARSWREWASFMKLAAFLCVAIVVINLLVSYHGDHVLATAPFSVPIMGTPTITLEAIVFGLAMGLRLLAVISALSIFTLTVHPDDMMLIMIKLRLPYKSVLVTSLASRFMPTLLNDMQRISDVQRSRGVELDRSGLVQKVKARMTVLIPLLSNSLDRSVQVAEAMEARAFGGDARRTFYRNIAMSRFDWMALLLAFTPCVIGLVMLVRGVGQYSYYPTLDAVAMTAVEWGALALLAALLGLIVPLAFLKRAVDLD